MLKFLRNGSQSLLLKLFLSSLLLLALAGLAFMDVQGMFQGGIVNADVVTMKGQNISTREFQNILDFNLRGAGVPRAEALSAGAAEQIVMQEIGTRIFSKAAYDLGLIGDEIRAARQIRSMLDTYLAGNEGVTEEEALRALQYSMKMDEQGMLESVKNQMVTDLLARALIGNAHVPQVLLDAAEQYKYEERRGRYFTLLEKDMQAVPDPSDEDLRAHYATIAARFAVPETRSFSVLVLDQNTLNIQTKTTEDDMKAHYDSHKEDYAVDEQRTISQLITKDQATAQAAFESGNLNAFSAKNKSVNLIENQTFTKLDIPEELADEAFKAEQDVLIAPIETPLGWHVVQVTKIIPEHTRPFEDVKREIAKFLQEDKKYEIYYEKINEVDDMLAGRQSLSEVAGKFGLKIQTFENITPSGQSTDGKEIETDVPAFMKGVEQAFTLETGESGALIETESGAFITTELTTITPMQNTPFEDVRDAVETDWRAQMQRNGRDQLAADISGRLKLGEPYNKIAEEFKKKPAKTPFVSRSTPTSDIKLAQGVIPALFSMVNTGNAVALSTEGKIVVLEFSDRRINTPKEVNEEERRSLESSLARSMQTSLMDQYRAHLIKKYQVEVNWPLIQELTAPEDDEG